MTFEGPEAIPQRKANESEYLASQFRALDETVLTPEQTVFKELERDLAEAGFTLAEEGEVQSIFNDQSLVCRSESFTKVLDLLLTEEPLSIRMRTGEANMCSMASGAGFRTAMLEGFSGNDVGGKVKVVATFRGDHLLAKEPIPPEAEIWRTKPETARVSFSGGGAVALEDLAMISFRFPINYFPERLLTENERERLEDGKIQFVVRHYTAQKKRTMH